MKELEKGLSKKYETGWLLFGQKISEIRYKVTKACQANKSFEKLREQFIHNYEQSRAIRFAFNVLSLKKESSEDFKKELKEKKFFLEKSKKSSINRYLLG